MVTNKKTLVLSLAIACAGVMSCAQAQQPQLPTPLQTAQQKIAAANGQPVQLLATEAAALAAHAAQEAQNQPTKIGKVFIGLANGVDKYIFKNAVKLVTKTGEGIVYVCRDIKANPGTVVAGVSTAIALTFWFLPSITNLVGVATPTVAGYQTQCISNDRMVALVQNGAVVALTPVCSTAWWVIRKIWQKMTAPEAPVAQQPVAQNNQ